MIIFRKDEETAPDKRMRNTIQQDRGFWEEARKAEIAMPLYLETLDVGSGLTGNDFLHGFCNMFALLLHERYGYPVYQCECENRMIHTYCRKGDWYIDVRGCTTDRDAFFEEFECPGKTLYDVPVEDKEITQYGFYEQLAYSVADNLTFLTSSYAYPTGEQNSIPLVTLMGDNSEIFWQKEWLSYIQEIPDYSVLSKAPKVNSYSFQKESALEKEKTAYE